MALTEVRLNSLIPGGRLGVRGGLSYDGFVASVAAVDPVLATKLEQAWREPDVLSSVLEHFRSQAEDAGPLRFPVSFNADSSLAAICYSLVSHLKPRQVIETGVGYGVTSSVILTALAENAAGDLASIDLPSLGDVDGEQTGLAVPPSVRSRWSCSRGSSRRLLPQLLQQLGGVDLFVSDSANVFTLQWFEWLQVRPYLSAHGAAVFNNAAKRFAERLQADAGYRTWLVRQREKPSCVTAVLLPVRGLRSDSARELLQGS